MKILETQSEVLSNYDVLKHITAVQASYAARDPIGNARASMPSNLAAILKDTQTYLTSPTQPFAPANGAAYTDAAFRAVFEQMPPFAKKNLTMPEMLHIVNHRPTDVQALECLIEEAENRFQVEQLEEIVAVVVGCLGEGAGS
ncbi:hypothetical protein W97_02498 [Coniosporium apollinis CBS 100218]|uniref:DNA-directed RNA polymerase III subunit RPC9 n=1 Tax=Coniosporium apollinis (strain CBS 100218) TaxID=1168221 RepID=R7YNP3_CONA1|nr:uncharacterized protein W97_02498 [Coniosporium apollinis CBS 100218]EON63271.1 hypothetical protein W97_02498 [Coniosporium apollinis CBS 100218]